MIKKIIDFFIFSNLFIALCAVLMVYQVALFFINSPLPRGVYVFIFFATVCSYNFHWYLTTNNTSLLQRLRWSVAHKGIYLILFFIGLVGTVIGFYAVWQHWFYIGIGTFFTFLYSAPKIPHKAFASLRHIAVGKTFFLTFVWVYVTTVLPIIIAGTAWQASFTWFTLSRFFLIYAICILFDYRDRADDKADGIRSMITWLNETGINIIFWLSLILFVVFTAMLYTCGFSILAICLLMLPGALVAALYNYAKKNFSDYLYYFVLDGLMMLSAILMLLLL